MSDDSLFARRPASSTEPEPIDVTPVSGDEESPAGERPAGPARSSRRRRIVGGVVLVAGLIGVGFLGSAVLRITQEKDATLGTPATVAGLQRDTSEEALTTADYLRTAFAAGIDLDESIGAVYGDPGAADRSVLLFGGTTLLWSPERDLDSMLELVADDTGAVSDVREVEPGPLGGVMKCGVSRGTDGDIPVCGWADHGSIAIAMFPGRDTREGAALMRDIRSDVQTRD
ncbi:hypothetical protein [Polymorphospora rubra]|uniref:Uncharacterized protein n=1 Tax=Polymorphospora rubra TaxID=338584 RepID=A0A810MWQ6_9ACTN|nr:hypothetical protein [Polymorphospora rubra]BCJ63845.1 hypothetical protein Prubr_08660 [Polymorphospora rubra]